MEATMFNEIIPYMMYIFEPLRTCTMYLSTHHGHSLTLVASNGLHFHKKKRCFMWKILLFLNFYSSTWLDLPSGPKEGKVLRWCQGTLYCWHLWPLMASNGLQNWKISYFGNFFAYFFSFFCKFNLSNGLYIAPGPQKGIL